MTRLAHTRLPNTHTKVASTGSYLPPRVVTNDEICERIDSTDEWIQQRTGIVERRFAARDESAVDMATKAARQAMERAGLSGGDVDAVIVACVTHPMQTPSAAAMVADQIGATPAIAFDVAAACSGFCHGVGLVHDMIRSGSIRTAVVVGVEKLSDFLDMTDRGAAFIFGDGAGAVVITASDEPLISPTLWGSDGSGWDLIRQEPGWDDVRYAREDGRELELEPAVRMEGRKVFKWAVWQMAPIARKIIEASGIDLNDLDAFIPHQANLRITDAMCKQIGLPERVAVAKAIAYHGNTSAASIPLALDDMVVRGDVKSGDTALLLGFGAGLAYAGQVIVIP